MNPKIETTITRRISFTVSKNQLLHYLTNKDDCGVVIPPRAKVVARVPYGAVSNEDEDMDIEEITISWEEIEHK